MSVIQCILNKNNGDYGDDGDDDNHDEDNDDNNNHNKLKPWFRNKDYSAKPIRSLCPCPNCRSLPSVLWLLLRLAAAVGGSSSLLKLPSSFFSSYLWHSSTLLQQNISEVSTHFLSLCLMVHDWYSYFITWKIQGVLFFIAVTSLSYHIFFQVRHCRHDRSQSSSK